MRNGDNFKGRITTCQASLFVNWMSHHPQEKVTQHDILKMRQHWLLIIVLIVIVFIISHTEAQLSFRKPKRANRGSALSDDDTINNDITNKTHRLFKCTYPQLKKKVTTLKHSIDSLEALVDAWKLSQRKKYRNNINQSNSDIIPDYQWSTREYSHRWKMV
jgi:hypothetical protein